MNTSVHNAIDLFPHNRTAYESAVSMLAETGKAAIIHPTGTGKSFIGFKLAEENPDAVVCWLSPSEYIFHTQIENLKKTGADAPANVVFFTYAKLMNMSEDEITEITPDFIILDEFHRCGAEQWGKGVEMLLNMYSDTPVLGLSATNIRYLDNQRDMADELFDGNIASEMTLGEAIVRGILNPPKYVLSVYSYKNDLDRYAYKVEHAKNKAVRMAAEKYLDALRRALENADGMDRIFEKHMTNRHGKYIVFTSGAEHMKEMIDKVPEWFYGVDPTPHIYSAYSNDPETSRAFAEFKADSGEHLKLLFCIDMLNEGVHVDDVDGVILLRPTVSPIIYKQQIGRALSAGKSKNAVIFDIVMNINNLYSIGSVKEEMQAVVAYYHYLGENHFIVNDSFEVIDEVKDCKRLFDQLEESLCASWDFMYEEAEKYHNQHHDLLIPGKYKTENGLSLGAWLITQRRIFNGSMDGHLTQQQIDKLNSLGIIWDNYNDVAWERFYTEAKNYYAEHKTLKVPVHYLAENGLPLGNWLSRMREVRANNKPTPLNDERIKLLDDIGMIWDSLNYQWEENFLEAAEYYRCHGNLNITKKYISPKGIQLGSWLVRMRQRYNSGKYGNDLTGDQVKRLESIGMVWDLEKANWDKAYEYAAAYYAEHGHLRMINNFTTPDGFKLGVWIYSKRKQYAAGRLKQEQIAALDSIGMEWNRDVHDEKWQQKYEAAKAFYDEHGSLEMTMEDINNGNASLYEWVVRMRKKRSLNKLTETQIKQLNDIGMPWNNEDDNDWINGYEEAKQYFKEHQNLFVPALYVSASGMKIGAWIIQKRKEYKLGVLSEEHSKALSNIGMSWNPHEDQWMLMYAEAERYFHDYGNLNVPNKYKTTSGADLGVWVSRQRMNQTTLSEERKALLDKIAMRWVDGDEMRFREMYELAKKYYAENGNLNISVQYELPDGTKLGYWVYSLRKQYQDGKLSGERIEMMNQIGMVWAESTWRIRYEQVKAYFDAHGDIDMPVSYKVDHICLKSWLNAQRKSFQDGRITKEHYELLDRIGMQWISAEDAAWIKMYGIAQQYAKKYDDCNCTAYYKTAAGDALGAWIWRQKKKYASGKLSKEQIAKLEDLGIIWNFGNAPKGIAGKRNRETSMAL